MDHFGDDRAGRIRVRRVEQPVECVWNDGRRHLQKRRPLVVQPIIADRLRAGAIISPIMRQLFQINYRGADLVGKIDGQQLVTLRDVVHHDLEANQQFKQRGRRMIA